MKETINDFKKIFVLDTNIILSGLQSLDSLSENGNNLIVIPQTVNIELRKFKQGFDELAFHARAFNRLLNKSVVKESIMETSWRGVLLEVDGKVLFPARLVKEFPPNFENDDKIVELANEFHKQFPSKVTMISNDIDVRTSAILEGIQTEPLRSEEVELDGVEFFKRVQTSDNIRGGVLTETLEKKTGEEIPDSVSCLEVVNPESGDKNYFLNLRGKLTKVDEKDLDRQAIRPVNMGQKFFSSLVLNEETDIVVVDSAAGTGKNIITFSSAIRLMDRNKDKYEKLVYIRNTINSVDKEAELGFLKGGLDEKLQGYLHPLYDQIEQILKHKNLKKKWDKAELETAVQDFIAKYQITSSWLGHARGRTFNNAIIVVDEASNLSKTAMQTLLTRVGKNCKVIIIGSNRQIDSAYLTKFNNGLTHILAQVGKENDSDILVAGCELTKSVRSPLAEWADKVFDK